jgi:hypothetical protein
MDKVTVNFSQGNENKLTLLEQRMGNVELLRPDFFFIEEEDIEIDGSRSPAKLLPSTQPRFDPLQDSKQLKGFQFCFDFYNPVDEPILKSETKGFCFEIGRFREELILIGLQDLGDGFFTLTDFVAEVRPDPDVGNISHAEQREEAFESLLFLRNFFVFLRSDVNFFLVFGRRFLKFGSLFQSLRRSGVTFPHQK